ncbi:CRISPR-associated protein, Cas5e family [Psychromonas ingrahamii 37]|uniref:CRISPR-associated protein, Cas5e family n=1 Tax=Psychromonas ingrahamii (strain DSM 17664 / CCUG 51855 / 37) TaxID=357804 RepID=A1SV73_PSYIN|nr:type I-E CRISPR-associated protein Cas5/CasD [Psychromonas ingrahamii]ABM03388.1 CRISPR-associated protein, Cas5e family [Psychromonas ingrahamii 37]
MKTLILKTEGMSAYGLQTFDVHRRANHFPTRSAIMGILGAAMGITRENFNELYALSEQLKIAVQVNLSGEKMVDYHTVQHFRSPQGKIQKGVKPTYREYWCDSEHTFAISAAEHVIEKLVNSVKFPEFTLFQGRKSCPLTRPLFEAVTDDDNPANALKNHGEQGQIFSDISGDNQLAIVQVRDLITAIPRKYAMRTVYVCGQIAKVQNDKEEMNEPA